MVEDAPDMRTELTNMRALGQKLAHHQEIYVPEPFPELSSRRVLTMTRVHGSALGDAADVEQAGWQVDELTDTVVSIYFEMVFEHGMFHADPHAGNFVLLRDGRLGILDFGDVGRFTAARREQLERMVLAVSLRDAEAFSQVLIDVTDPSPSADLSQLRIGLGGWFDRHIDVGVGELDLSSLTRSVMDLFHRHGLTLPADFTLLIKVLMQLQSLSNDLNVTLDPAELLAPHVRRILRSRLDPRRLARELASAGLRWRQLAAALVASAQLISRDTPPKVAGISVPGAAAVGVGALAWGRMTVRRRSRFSLMSAAQNVVRLRPRPGAAGLRGEAD